MLNELCKIFTRAIGPALKRLEPDRVITGRRDHPARQAAGPEAPPDYVGTLVQRHVLPEFCFCLKGPCCLHIGTGTYRVATHDLCFIGRNQSHFETYRAPGTPYELVWFSLYSVSEMHILASRYQPRSPEAVPLLHAARLPAIVPLLETITAPAAAWPEVKAAIRELYSRLDRYLAGLPAAGGSGTESPAPTAHHRRLMKLAERYIDEHAAEKLTLQEVAARVDLNPKYFATLFHAVQDLTFLKYLTFVRLEKACRLLNDSTLNITQIAGAAGFTDYSDFSRVFRKMYGLSPRQFRDRYTGV